MRARSPFREAHPVRGALVLTGLAVAVLLLPTLAGADHVGGHATPCDEPATAGGGTLGLSPGPTGPPSSLGWDVGSGQCNGSFSVTSDPGFSGGALELALRAEQRRIGQVALSGANDYTVLTGPDVGPPLAANRAWWNFQASIAYAGSIAGLDALTLEIATDVGPNLPAAPVVDLLAIRGIIDDRNNQPNATVGFADLYQISQNPEFGWFAPAADGDANPTGAFDYDEPGAWRFILTATEGASEASLSVCIHTPGESCEVPCPDPDTPGLYGGYTAGDCASSVVKAKNQAQLDAYLADFGVGGGTKPKHVNVQFNPTTDNFTVISPCRIKVLGDAKLIDVTADNVCLYGRAGVTVGAGTPAAGSLIDVDNGDILMVSEEGKVQTEQGIGYLAGEMTLEAADTAEIGTGSTVDVLGSLSVTSSAGQALIQPGASVTADELTMSAPQQVRIRDNAGVDVTNDLTLTSAASAAEIQAGSIVTVGGNLALSGLTCQIGASADVDVTGAAILTAAGSATASDASILSGASLTAADVSQTAEHKAVLSGGATVDATGNAEIDAPACVINGTVTAATTSGFCLP